jgi:Zn-dependent metalloprotease
LIATELGGKAWEIAGKIWYYTLRDHLRENSSFQDAAKLTHGVAGNYFGKGSPEQKAVANGWREVGILIKSDKESIRRRHPQHG